MKIRFSLRSKRSKIRVHKTVDLLKEIELHGRGEILNLSELVHAGLPSVTVESVFLEDPIEVNALLPSSTTAKEAIKLFRDWEIYGVDVV